MRNSLLVILLLFSVLTNAQKTLSEFTGTGFGIQLPDTGYTYLENKFYSRYSKTSILLINQEADFSNMPFDVFIQMMMKELAGPGTTILSNKILPDSSRLMKILINFDSTDKKPATTGRKDIAWLYFYNYQKKPVLLIASYPLESDKLLAGKMSESLKTFGPIANKKGSLFKNQFTITDDYAPLKLCGPSFGGIRLNMEGKYDITGKDSSYCLIVPVNMKLPVIKADSMRSYLLTRLQVHANGDVRSDLWSWGNSSGYLSYLMTANTKDNRIIFLGIRSDEEGYFEIWGESYNNNEALIPVFKKITESLRRTN